MGGAYTQDTAVSHYSSLRSETVVQTFSVCVMCSTDLQLSLCL